MSHLFSPLTIHHVPFRNRIAMPPMVISLLPEMSGLPSGDPVTDRHIEHYGKRAAAGCGLIIVEATAVSPSGRCWPGGLLAYSDDHVAGLERLAAAIASEGTVPGIQLVHGGPQANPALVGQPLGPSDAPDPDGPGVRALTVAEIQAIEADFVSAAERVVAAGFKVIELHGAHGFLLDSFLSAERNCRCDAYGGNLAGRMRMLVETARLVGERIGERAVLACRFSLWNKAPGEFDQHELEQLVDALVLARVGLLDVSTRGVFEPWFGEARTLGQWVKGMTGVPVIVAGGIRQPAEAERVIAEGHGDFAAVGSAMLEDAEWAAKAARARR